MMKWSHFGDHIMIIWWNDLVYIRLTRCICIMIKWPKLDEINQVDKVSRNRCTYCRWQKCLNSGMNQASVQEMVIILVSYHCHIFVILSSHHCRFIVITSASSDPYYVISRRGKRGSRLVMTSHNLALPCQACQAPRPRQPTRQPPCQAAQTCQAIPSRS